MTNPYKGLPDFCFWSRAVSWPAPGQLDPCTISHCIQPHEKVATLGSCFAQHLARHVKAQGLNYYVPELAPPEMTEAESVKRNYGTFSARYGNVYTVRQAVQLFDRAFGLFVPVEQVWPKEGGFVDAFRPQIDPTPLTSPAEVELARSEHLARVRDVFSNADWIVFTLGLTEGWRSRVDQAVYPVAPGVSGGEFVEDRYEFVNFSATEVRQDLCSLVDRIGRINPGCRLLLTVSPVPLIATYERRHVWTSTTFSKSALRVACDEVERLYPARVTYFPSYEIITSPAAAGRYYADDLRQVTETGVKHVMRVFGEHFIVPRARAGAGASAAPPNLRREMGEFADVVCDEEVIERALQFSGVRTTVPAAS